jgi:hypothetical protein
LPNRVQSAPVTAAMAVALLMTASVSRGTRRA